MRKSHFKDSERKYGGGYSEVENSESGSLTVTARVSNGASRYAMPSMPELVYAALLYKDGESSANPPHKDFAQGTEATDCKLNFSFQKPDDTDGKFTLEIFAFAKTEGEETPQFSKETALLSGSKTGLSIVGDTIEIDGTIALAISSTEPGTVSLKIKVPAGCSLFISEKDEAGESVAESESHFTVTGTSPNYTVKQKVASGIPAKAYPLTFTVKKGVEIVHIFFEYINVINGFCTDTWSGLGKDDAKEITQSMISSTVYVRGTGGWYDKPEHYKDTATASDSNSGSFLSPLASIQKAIDKIIAINDGASAYTIYVDGTLDGTAADYPDTKGMADFSKCDKNLNLTIKALSETEKATLDANKLSRVIYAKPASSALNLTLENLTLTGGNTGSSGGGVFVTGGAKLTMKNCTITGNEASYGGGVYVANGSTFIMEDGEIRNNNVGYYGGGVFVTGSESAFKMSGSASIPAEDDGKNDVYLYASGTDIPTITVAGDLTASSPVATITPSDYVAGRQILSAGGIIPAITQDICGKFAVSQKGWEIAPNDDGTAGVLGISIYLNSSSGDDANSGLTASKAVKTLTKAIELFESQSAQKIMVCAEYTLPSEESTLLDRAGKEHLTLMRYIGKSDVSGAFLGKLLTISQGNVTITNVTLDGTIKGYSTDELLSISGSGTEVTLGDDAIICNNSYSGVCVSSYNGNGKFKMTGGAITGNRTSFGGGGVKISYGTFEMSGGIISGNSGGSYGGGVDIGTKSGCKFTMSGGEISGNYAKRGAGVNVSKGLYTGTFEMSGGTISENQSYGTGDSDGGGGVYVSGKFTMSGGEITGNTAKSQGGGVFVYNGGTFNQTGGTVTDNTPDNVYEQP